MSSQLFSNSHTINVVSVVYKCKEMHLWRFSAIKILTNCVKIFSQKCLNELCKSAHAILVCKRLSMIVTAELRILLFLHSTMAHSLCFLF